VKSRILSRLEVVDPTQKLGNAIESARAGCIYRTVHGVGDLLRGGASGTSTTRSGARVGLHIATLTRYGITLTFLD